MERFHDQPLRESPHVAVLFADKLGGFVVATALLRGLHEKYPDLTLDYFGGERTAELEESCEYIQSRYSLYGRPGALRGLPSYLAAREAAVGPYDLAINLDFNPLNAVVASALAPRYVVGKCVQPDGRKELPLGDEPREQIQSPNTFWAGENFLARFGSVLESNYIGEIFCRVAYVETDFHRTEVPTADPGLPIPDVLIATGGTRTAKLWPIDHWEAFINRCGQAALTAGLLGAAPKLQQIAYGSASADEYLLTRTSLIDLRGKFTLPQVAGALARARACVSIDNGPMHIASAVGTPTVAIFGGSPWDLWAPRADHLRLALPTEQCSLCRDNRFLNDHCLRERQVCMESISADDVFERMQGVMRAENRT
ncbi:MAG TPA: glycosyltransferase family 9 protein [Chloroflexota bacterium]|nr:glycosyltransferase family 9 protein [Chloroflexota bacterium]